MSAARVDLGRALKGGAPVLLELAALFCAGGSAAAVGWALLDPVQSAGSEGALASTPGASGTALAWRTTVDPFRRDAPTATLASFGSAEGYALHATRVSLSGASAILTAPGQPQTSYAIGARVGDDAKLVSVAHDHVILERAGQRIRVTFPTTQSTPLVSASFAAPAAPPAPIAATTAAPASQLASAMGFEAVTRPDGRVGLAVAGAAPSGLAASAGLQAGDVVLALNGRDITADGLAARQGELLSGAPVEIRYERNGQVLTTRLGRLE